MVRRHILPTQIPHLRLARQHISRPAKVSAATMVTRLVAVQAQDFAGAKWALGLRLQGVDDQEVERGFNAGEILRTHLLRPTWHFVSPADIQWLLMLTGPRVQARNAPMCRKLGLDARTLSRSLAAITRALERHRHLTRAALREVLKRAGIKTEGPQRMTYMMMHAELEGAICSGPRDGKQFTYALLDQRAAPTGPITRDQALARLSERYFATRAPATVHDFAKWSGLSVSDARRGLEATQPDLVEDVLNGKSYWTPLVAPAQPASGPRAYLLSVYDEYISSYRDHSAIVGPEHGRRLVAQGNALAWVIVLDGRIVGTWRRVLRRDGVRVDATPFVPLSSRDRKALDAAVERYGRHLGLEASLWIES